MTRIREEEEVIKFENTCNCIDRIAACDGWTDR